MDDRLKETLSAMMDDEADELSVRRLLSHAEQDQVRSQWQRWQQVRDLMHQGGVAPEAVDVSAGVRDALDGGGAVSPAATVGSMPRRDKSWHWPAVAMVTLAAVIGFGAGAGWEHLSRYLLEHAQHNSVGAGRGSVGYARVVSASGPEY